MLVTRDQGTPEPGAVAEPHCLRRVGVQVPPGRPRVLRPVPLLLAAFRLVAVLVGGGVGDVLGVRGVGRLTRLPGRALTGTH
ncbi:hypothetical protein SDIAM103S_02270 [Streptomyces diastaticus subsp. diastaticus]